MRFRFLLPLFVTAMPIIAGTMAHAHWDLGPSGNCVKTLDSLSFLEKTSLLKKEMDLPRIASLEELPQSALGKQVVVRPVDMNLPGEIHIHRDDIRKSLLIGCEGESGRLISFNKYSVILQMDDGRVKTIPENENYVQEILVQELE
jgi:hypothetical protein